MHSGRYLLVRDALISSGLLNNLLFLHETIRYKNSSYCVVLSSVRNLG